MSDGDLQQNGSAESIPAEASAEEPPIQPVEPQAQPESQPESQQPQPKLESEPQPQSQPAEAAESQAAAAAVVVEAPGPNSLPQGEAQPEQPAGEADPDQEEDDERQHEDDNYDEGDGGEGDEDAEVVYVEPRSYIGVIRSGEFGMQGLRSTMEDHTQVLQHPHFNEKFRLQDDFPRSFFAVYDGHGGSVCSEYCSRHVHNLMIRNKYMGEDPKEALRCGLRLVERAFLAACRRIDIETSSGTTAICVYVEQDRLVCGNVGDSRAVLCTVEPRLHDDGSPLTEEEELRGMDDPNYRPKVIAVPLSIDHKPARDCERIRVESRGGQVATTAVEAKQVQLQHLKRRQRRLAQESKARHSPHTREVRLHQLRSNQQQQPPASPGHAGSGNGSGEESVASANGTLQPSHSHPGSASITASQRQLRAGPGTDGLGEAGSHPQHPLGLTSAFPMHLRDRRRRPRGRLTPREAKILRIAEEIDADRALAAQYGVLLDPEEGLGESRSFLDDQAEYAMQNYSSEDSFGGESGLGACCTWCCNWLASWAQLDRPFRVFPGGLSVSRAVGDIGLKRDKLIVADAEMSERQLTENDRFLILACDGVWDVMSSQAAVDFVYQKLIVEGVSCHSAAAELAEEAYRMGSTDNISVVVVQLGPVGDDASSDSLQNGNNPYYCAVSGEVMDGPAGQQQGHQIEAMSAGAGVDHPAANRARMPFASLSQAQAAALRIKVDEVVHHPPQVVPQRRRNSQDMGASPLDILLEAQGGDEGSPDDDHKEDQPQ